MRQTIESLVNRVWYPKKRELISSLMIGALLPFSALYRVVIFFRKYYLKLKSKQYNYSVPIVVVGNITVGGTGKTPFVIYLSQFLQQNGFQPGIISRGYGGLKSKNQVISINSDSNVLQVGEEPYLIHQKTQCPVVVGIKRNQCIQHMNKQFPNVDIIISDDGLQHYVMPRDLEIILIDGQRQLGNGHCLPAGPLREPKSRLKQVEFLVSKNAEYEQASKMSLLTDKLVSLKDPTRYCSLSQFKDQTVHAVTGIANANSFFNLLMEKGLKVIQHAFADHHFFQNKDIQFEGEYPIIMTEKDAVKCLPYAQDNHWILPISAHLPLAFESKLLRKIKYG